MVPLLWAIKSLYNIPAFSLTESMVLRNVWISHSFGGEVQVSWEFCSQVPEEWSVEIDRLIGAASVVVQALYWSVVVKNKLNCKAKLTVYWSAYNFFLIYSHKLWIVTEQDCGYMWSK